MITVVSRLNIEQILFLRSVFLNGFVIFVRFFFPFFRSPADKNMNKQEKTIKGKSPEGNVQSGRDGTYLVVRCD